MPSAPLVLKDDPSVLFTSAGMQPIVPYFLGQKQAPAKRLVTVQKCFRTTDLDVVGFDTYHNTFFEMLGNFGIGDYWKKEAIGWGWELLTTQFEIDPKTLVATIYFDDDEAFDIWTKELALLPPEKVFRLGNLAKGDDTNFWSPGPTGLCGPCSEVFVDRGPQPGVKPHDCNPGEDCGRYLEIWNFVFQQYDRQEDGTLVPLAKRNIDTGAGLERLSQPLQGVTDVFKTDLFQPLMKRVETLSGSKYGDAAATDVSMRVVAEHARAAAFLIADGIAPSNEGRGYVLRRLIRRASLHARRLDLKTGAITQVAGEVVKTMQKHHHELTSARERIAETIGAAALAGQLNRQDLGEERRRYLELLCAAIARGTPLNATHVFWDYLIGELGCPFLKRDLLLRNPMGLPFVSQWRLLLERASDYDTDLIIQDLESALRHRSI